MKDTVEASIFEEMVKEIEKAKGVDEKVALSLKFMKGALSDGKRAQFKDFWRLKKICLDLFKQDMHPTKRALLWNDYTKLLGEAHGLQKILEEQTNFHIDQLELAIEGLEKEIEESDKWLKSIK